MLSLFILFLFEAFVARAKKRILIMYFELFAEKKASDKAVLYQFPVIASLKDCPFDTGILSLKAKTEEVFGPNISTRPFELLQFIIFINQKKKYTLFI